MQSGQDCLIYHMLGYSLRRLHVSRTKIGSLLTGWFAERLWAELASKPVQSPEHPPNTSSMLCALQDLFRLLQRFFNRWKVEAKWIQSADCHSSENRSRGSRKLSCKNTMWEDSAICQGWVGEKLFRALQDAQLHSVPEFAIDLGLCKKLKLPATCVKGLLRVHKEKRSLRQSLNLPWSQSGLCTSKSSFILPTQRICSAGAVCDTPLGHRDGFTSTNLCFVIVAPARYLWK